MTRLPTAAQALYGHLKTGTPEPVPRRERNGSVAVAMYPRPEPPPPNPYREALLKALREINAKHARREGRSR